MISIETNSTSALTNLRKVRMSLQKQEQAFIQKEFSDVLSTIIGLLHEHQLTVDDVETAMSSKLHKLQRKSKKKSTEPNTSSTPAKPTTGNTPALVGHGATTSKPN